MDHSTEEANAYYSDVSDVGQPDNNHYSAKRCVMPWCGYCGYEFKTGDRLRVWHKQDDLFIVTRLSLDVKYKPSWEIEQKRSPEAEGSCQELAFCACGLSAISRCKYWYDACRPACHEVCHDLRKATQYDYPTLFDFSEVRWPSFKPVRSDSSRRCAFMEDDLVSVLGGSIPNLPRETLHQIAEYTLYEHAIIHLATSMGNQLPKFSTLDLRKNVWVEYIDFEGQRYTRALFNETDEAFTTIPSENKELIFDATADRLGDTIFIEMAPLGVRRVIFPTDSPMPAMEEEPDIWWKVMRFQDEPAITTATDGLKLRELMFQSERKDENSASIRDVLWPTPSSHRLYKLVSDIAQESSLYSDTALRQRSRRMDSVWLNGAGIYGLSLAIYNATVSRPIITIHVHQPGEDFIFYREVERKVEGNVSWLYIPLGSDEVITEIWAKNAHEDLPISKFYDEELGRWAPDLANLTSCEYWELLLTTSKGHVHQIGSARDSPNQTWTSLHNSMNGLKRIFFENTDDTRYGSWSIGFSDEDSHHEPLRTSQLPSVLQSHQTVLLPHTSHETSMNCSGASLDKVTEVTPCLRKPNRFSTVTKTCVSGLLLRYQDGHVERVGEARLDSVRASQKVLDPTQVLRFTVQEEVVKSCTVSATEEDDGSDTEYIDIPLRGMLEWCFDAAQAWISHDGCQIYPIPK
ncbi:unnamed protein product [Clonostachys rosea f. rosea IK726]|uniref:Uncharacterized protein n=2 Tax=Bionectria ochroleuca TaxID=29856 RepID=A0ACA9ULS8_BIOOC|nr:unnamed protein product [Clonostachys rosea f. rosea IK726]